MINRSLLSGGGNQQDTKATGVNRMNKVELL